MNTKQFIQLKPVSDIPTKHLLSKIINWGVVILFVLLVVFIYWYFFHGKYTRFGVEGFNPTSTNPTTTTKGLLRTTTIPQTTHQSTTTIPQTTHQSTTSIPQTTHQNTTSIHQDSESAISNSNSNSNSNSLRSFIAMGKTIYEKSLTDLFGSNIRMMCNMLPTLDRSVCIIGDTPFVKYSFPVHMIKMQDTSILAVFNDGRLYSRDSIYSTVWKGPLDNSLPNDSIPLRMITLTSDLTSLLGVGYDNKLYIRGLITDGKFNSDQLWKPVPNNTNIIYVLYDRETNGLISIDINGIIFIKSNPDLTSDNIPIINPLIDRPILRLYYDAYGYMLAIDSKFDLYQFKDKKWKTNGLNMERGHNLAKIQDILYCNDGKMVGLVFVNNANMLHIMKQSEIYFLSEFMPLDIQSSIELSTNKFLLSDSDIINAKIGYINPRALVSDDDTLDQDTSFAFHKQSLENQKKLRDFCSSRNSTLETNYDNYDLLSGVEQNTEKINLLQGVLDNLIKYDPDKQKIQDQFPLLYPPDFTK